MCVSFELRRLRVAAVSLALVCGCRQSDGSARDGAPDSSMASTESLALSAPDGVEVWYTLSRPATASAGQPCVERGLEIRRHGERIQVPLLYTGDTPTLTNDSTMRATLWTNCRPVATYLVDLRSGRPVRQPDPGR
jgi:hypothetical protein